MDDQQCVACGRVFGGASKPRWAFTRDGQLAGRIHSSCLNRRGVRDRFYAGHAVGSWEESQFYIWCWEMRPKPTYGSDAWWAALLADDPTVELTSEQEDRLSWWCVRGPLKLGQERAEAIREARRRLVRAFLAWRESLMAVGRGS